MPSIRPVGSVPVAPFIGLLVQGPVPTCQCNVREQLGVALVDATGTIGVVVSVGEDGLPVRIDYDIEPGTITRLDFTRWGEPVTVKVPQVG